MKLAHTLEEFQKGKYSLLRADGMELAKPFGKIQNLNQLQMKLIVLKDDMMTSHPSKDRAKSCQPT